MNKLVSFLNQNFSLQERLASFKKRQIHTLEIELTDKCNLSCFYCYAEDGIKGEVLSLEKAKEILEQAKKYGIKQIAWLGGEPTLNKNWAEILGYSKGLGFRNELWSNGTTLNEENIENIINLCDVFVIHVDSIQQNEKILESFDRLLESGFPSEKIRLNITLTRSSLPDLEDTLNYFMSRRIQTVTLIPLYKIGKGKSVPEKEFLSKSELHKAFKKRAEIENRPELMLLGASEFCKHYQLTTAYIKSNGDIIPYTGTNVPVGNIYNDNLKDVLKSSFDALSFAKTVSKDSKVNHIDGNCGVCGNSEYCFGTRSNSFINFGNLSESDPMCWKV